MIDLLGTFTENSALGELTVVPMKHLILFSLLTLAAFAVSAHDTPCQVDLYQSQGQFNKAIQKPNNKDLNRIMSQQNLTLPEVMAKADRFKIVKLMPEEHVIEHEKETVVEELKIEPADVGTKLGGMFQLLIPAKLRNPAR